MDCVWVKSTKKDAQNMGTIYLRVHTQEKDARYSLGLSIKKEEWEKYRSAKYKVSDKMRSLGINYNIFAEILERVKDAFHDGIDTKHIKQTVKSITDNTIRDARKRKIKPGILNNILFTDYLTSMIEDMQSGDRLHQGKAKPVAKSYIKRAKAVVNVIKRYEDDIESKLTLDDINLEFSRDFTAWSVEQGLSPNYTAGNMRLVRVAISEAYTQGKAKCNDFKKNGFVPSSETVDQVFLTPEQINELIDLDVSTPKKILRLVEDVGFNDEQKDYWQHRLTECQCHNVAASKDIFVVGCLTGQRLSDYSRINEGMFTKVSGNEYIHLFQTKTGKEVYIPLDYRVKEIVKRNGGSLPHVWEGDFNDYCRLLAELLHWTWEAKIDKTHIGVKRGPRFCDMISSHTARRSFATNAYAAGVPISSIMAVTGHSSERKLRIYLKLQAEDKAVIATKDMEKVMRLK